METWVNWHDYLHTVHPGDEVTFDNFIRCIKEEYVEFTPEFAAREAGVEAEKIVEAANIVYIANKCIKQEYQRLFLKISPVFPALKI